MAFYRPTEPQRQTSQATLRRNMPEQNRGLMLLENEPASGLQPSESSMHHRTLEEISQVATIDPAPTLSRTELRRQRLHRLADLLDSYTGPIRLLTRIEYLPPAERHALRGDLSPLTVAYADADFRRAGLVGDTVGNAMEFFDLSSKEVHTLFCDCHFGSSVDARRIAAGIRNVASRTTLRERLESIRAYLFRT